MREVAWNGWRLARVSALEALSTARRSCACWTWQGEACRTKSTPRSCEPKTDAQDAVPTSSPPPPPAMVALRSAAAVVLRRLPRRLVSSSSSAASSTLLGHFHQPRLTTGLPDYMDPPRPSPPTFQALAASSPLLSLDFLPVGFSLYDSHLGLLLLLQQGTGSGTPRLLVCDPFSPRHALLPLPPADVVSAGGYFVGAALLSRPGSFEFDAACLTVDAACPRAWVASFRDGECRWRATPRSGEAEIDFHPYWLEQRCVHAAGSLYWHICNNDSALALDPATMEFSFLREPALMLDERPFTKYRFGEMPDDGRLCVAALEG